MLKELVALPEREVKMAVIDLRGDVARSLASLGQSIGGIIDPDKASRKRFQELLASNPQLAAALGRIEREAPGTLKNILPFDIPEEVISGLVAISPSIAELQADIQRPGLTPEAAGGELPPEVASALSEFARARAVGTTPTGLALEPKRVAAAEAIPQEAVTAGLEREVTGLTPGQTAQDKFNLEIFNTANTTFGELGLDEQQAAALRTKLPAAFFDADSQEAFRQRKEIAQMQIDAQNLDRANERTDNFRRGVAARWTERTKTGLPETWQLFLFDKEANVKAKELASGAKAPENETDIRLLEVAQAFSRADQVDKITEEAAVRTQIGALIGRIEKRDSEGKYVLERTVREALLNQLNNAFMELHNLSEGRTPLSIGDIKERGLVGKVFHLGREGNQPLRVIDEAGNEVDLGLEQPDTTGTLNLETVDVSKLSSESRDNLLLLMQGGSFEDLQRQAPRSAQEILNARRNR